jgi:hypothetical protein
MRRLLPLLVFLLAGCQPLPHPFADDRPPPRAPILSPRDSAGIVVAPVASAPSPTAMALAEAMAAALRHADIPASTQGGNKGSYRLAATAREQPSGDGRSSIVIDWVLSGADGRSVGHVTTAAEPSAEAWRAGDEATAQEIAAAGAPAIARLVQDEPPVMSAAADPRVALRPVVGAPGDGARSLTRAMDDALRRAHVLLADKPGEPESFVLTGKVEMSPPVDGKQQVKVSWALLRPNGSQIGQISQENAVPAGSLDGAWGDIAYAVANAAAPGVAALIERAKAVAVGS